MKDRILWIVLAGILAGVVIGVVFYFTRSDRPPPAPPEPAVLQPSGETVNRATGTALKALSECMQDGSLPQCKEKPMVTFIFSARGGGGRILDLTLVKGWLDPDLFKCWSEKLKKILVPAAGQTGKVNVQYPLACDEQGKIHIRPPAWGGSISKKNLPKR
jgi:hypothetical protein